ncbi:3-oxoacyl-[acyl-carrier-protein] reductase [Waddlia chondrophila 2032/99]|uniref:3-oxoacyl-[acyl-carrier-protein] reductase n=2 Tax=Waddlia chondrophila TaxID=71667 RepID=D6YWN3_WADCW|nr:3-oxoacyl-ACP reductase FabG [Waddlia chondrophila]ADI38544.1 3-oxoacyl-[acyl-carrier-protein] reductase protein FabG [Waddlia chondrophila WSU 86-1044]CCB91026.1 3-oxoacyl-[acyl-carrier-protein] reductase [Waddlia chondrophila 2032/99]
MRQLLKDQTAIVTGGSAGIGRAITRTFVEHGATIAIFGTHAERGKSVAEEINAQAGGEAVHFFQVDVSDKNRVGQAVNEVLSLFGKVDILVNNAGITRDQLLMKMTEDDWDEVMAVNVKSCYNTCQALVRQMMKARRGKMINMSSVVGLTGNAGQANYAASKSAIIGFSKALAKELAPRNICVNCVAPGFIDTRMTEALGDQQKQAILSQIPFGKMGSVEDVANAVLFLASSLSDYITGQVITVDGGMIL